MDIHGLFGYLDSSPLFVESNMESSCNDLFEWYVAFRSGSYTIAQEAEQLGPFSLGHNHRDDNSSMILVNQQFSVSVCRNLIAGVNLYCFWWQ